jgi:hypothetical protein
MNAARFDGLLRSLALSTSRRGLVADLVGSLLAVLAVQLSGEEALAGCGGRCAQCERCRNGRCRPKEDQTPCGSEGTRQCCAGRCVSLETNPRHCGECGRRCQINAVCDAGICACVRGACPANDATCCPTTAVRTDVCRCTGATDPRTCETAGSVDLCPSGTVACLGPRCAACCPVGSTCDTSTGTCLR